MERNKLTRLPRRITSLFMAMVMVLSLLVGFSTTSYANESQLSFSKESYNTIKVTDNNGTPDNSSDDKTATYTVTAESVDYNGQPHGALVTLRQSNPDNPITGIPAANTVQITYQNYGIRTDIDSAPVNPGYYTASITIGQKTAYADFIIYGNEQDTRVEAVTGLFYTGEAQDLVTVTPGHGTVEYCVQTEEQKNAHEAFSYSPTVPKATDAGTYYVFYRILGNSGYYSLGYDGTTRPYVTVTIHEALPEGISISNYVGTYDGQAHGINVDLNNSGARIIYSMSPNGDNYTTTAPTVTDVNNNPTTVYWALYTDDQNEPNRTGSNTIKINRKELTVKWSNTTVDKEAIREAASNPNSIDWSNELNAKPTIEGKESGDDLNATLSYQEIPEEGFMPSQEPFTTVSDDTRLGTYKVTAILSGTKAGNYVISPASVTTTYTLKDSYKEAMDACDDAFKEVEAFTDEVKNPVIKNYPEIKDELDKISAGLFAGDENPTKTELVEVTAEVKEALEGAKNAIAFIEAAKKIPAAEKVTLDDVASVRAADEALENVPVAFLEAIPKNAEHKKIADNFAAALKKIIELIKADEEAKKAAEEAAKKEAEEAARKAAEEEAKIEVPNWTVYKGNVVAVDKNGKVVKKTGIATWKGYNLLIANGVLYKKPAFFLDKSTGKYKYFVNGIQAKTGDTFVYYGGKLLRVTNGELNQETGFVKFGGKYYISYKGVAATFFTGTVTIKGYKVKVVKGAVVGISK